MSSAAHDRLAAFISTEMRMSHVYQPVMLSVLLQQGGTSDASEIAGALLARDQAQLDYYTAITKQMPGTVLRKRGIVEYQAGRYTLAGFGELTPAERLQLIGMCEAKVEAFLGAHADPWSHRRKSAGYIPGTLRYEVLKRARFRCELCGVGAEERALEVDHILPRNRGGGDEQENLQALCYSCNAMKRDRDDTDFRGMAQAYALRSPGCVFCEMASERVVSENTLFYAIRDTHPVTDGHTLLIPKRHLPSGGELAQAELNAMWALHGQQRAALQADDTTIHGFNLGLNDGAVAGQTVDHCHFHLIPRREGDVPDALGGVLGVTPERK